MTEAGQPGAQVVSITGSLDLTTAGQWGQVLRTAAAGGPAVVLDARALEFIDSTGVGELLTCARELERRGCRLMLQNLSPELVELLQVLGVAELLGVT